MYSIKSVLSFTEKVNRMSADESTISTNIPSTSGSAAPGPSPNNISKDALVELYVIIHTAGLWERLSEQSQTFGETLLKEAAARGYKIEPPAPVGLTMSMPEYMQLVNKTLNFKGVDSHFWQIVVQIVFLMMSIERDPILAQKLKEQNAVSEYVQNIFGE